MFLLFKKEISCSNAKKEALEECKELDKDKFEMMQRLAQAYSGNRECSVQEAVYQLMPELWLHKGYLQLMFANTNLPEERFSYVFKSEEELSELPELKTVKMYLNEIYWMDKWIGQTKILKGANSEKLTVYTMI